ncbi:hypothetical protein [Mariprofundus ferrooxydans]|uniref:hypothetical protein n=1 Tax=Mariprofundus ferrooxydans TaxID=314344 RepID=UPI001F0D8B59|nr:hypothetical protein [Mariprofundus ferrooxydans]
MILKNQKIHAIESSVDDVNASIGRDFRVKKQDSYEVQDLKSGEKVCVEALLKRLRVDATPVKEVKISPQKQRKPIARSTRPIARTPITRSTKPIARQPASFPSNKSGSVQSWRASGKKPKPGRNDIIDDQYSAWLGGQPCIITGMVADRGVGPDSMHCHHIRGRSRGRRNDYAQVPLIGHMHTWSNHSYHVLGKSSFLERWKDYIPDGVDDIVVYFEARAKAFKAQYDAEMKGLIS